MKSPEPITKIEYNGFQAAFDHFNKALFNGKLPHVMVTLQRRARSGGYFAANRFSGRANKKAVAHELALNPDAFLGSDDRWVCSVLVHEQAHLLQHEYGKPSGAYHNKEYCAMMKAVGLQTSDTGKPGGRQTGQRMSHYIIPGGPYDVAYKTLKATGFKLHWQSALREGNKTISKVKYTCNTCSQNAWARPKAKLICGQCYEGVLMADGTKEFIAIN